MKRFFDAHAPVWIALGAATSGLSTYALLAVVAAGLGPERFDSFSLYWSLLIVISVGGYLPVEQIVASRIAGRGDRRALSRWGIGWGLATAVVGVIVFVIAANAGSDAGSTSAAVVAVFALNLVAVAFQALLRGLAAGYGEFRCYAGIVICDSLLRTIGCAVLAWAGVEAIAAYAGAVVLGCAVSAGYAVIALASVGRRDAQALSTGTLTREAGSLAPAMISMQVLLNSPIFVATLVGGGSVSAGALLALTSLVRTPVFITQAAQAAYVGRIAALVHAGSAAVGRAVRGVLGLAVALAVATVAGSWLLGPWAVGLLYGDDYVVGRGLCLLIGLGIGLYLVATVANDLAVARGLHGAAGRYWVLGLIGAVAVAAVLPTGDARIVAPILIGSGLALGLTLARPRPVRL